MQKRGLCQMNILILNGSPKGKNSITLQTMLYIRKMFPGHNYRVLHVGQKIRGFERDFSKAKTMLETADLIVFAYPVYTFIAPSQMHRFIELMKESGVRVAGKFVTQVTTSKHFYDVTAHRYIQDNCQDMKMKFIKGLSADMDDLLTEKGQKEAVNFFDYVLRCVEKDYFELIPAAPRKYKPVEVSLVTEEDDAFVPDSEKTGDVVVVADLGEEDEQLSDMIARFRAVSKRKVRLVNLREYPFRGGCLGCFHCATDGECIYIDGFDKFLREKIQTAEAIVYAFTIRDHSMGALFKMYDDRQFCNGHRTVTMGMPMAYIISGDYRKEPNLQMIIEGRSEVGGNFLAGVATDEKDPNAAIDKMADNLDYALRKKIVMPQNFYGVGGMKIFRDLIYLMQGMMKADHAFYKAHGQYDFPQKQKGTVLKMYLVGALLDSPKVKEKMGDKMTEGMLAPYKKVLDRIVLTDGRK